MGDLKEAYSEWQNNPEFRDAFKKNPQEALKQWNINLNDEDLQKMLKVKEINNELDKRINK